MLRASIWWLKGWSHDLIPAGWLICFFSVAATGVLRTESVDAQTALPGSVHAFRLVRAAAPDVAPQLSKMLKEAGASAEVLVDRSGNRILVRGPASSVQLAAQLVTTLDKDLQSMVVQASAQQPAVVRGYAVVAERLDATVTALQKAYPPSTGVRIAGDQRTSQVIVIGPPDTQTKVSKYLVSQKQLLLGGESVGLRRVPSVEPLKPYRLRNITSDKLQSELKKLWGDGLAVSRDANGPGIVVSVRGAAGVAPVLRIDSNTGTIDILAAGVDAKSWRRVVAALDHRADPTGGTTQLVPLKRADPVKVRQAVTLVRDAVLRTPPGQTMQAVPVQRHAVRRGPAGLVSKIFQTAAVQDSSTPDSKATAGQPATATPSEAVADEAGMLGDVQIEYIPELGVIVLRGNHRDVQRVQKIIAEIEKQSEVTQPEIEVISLTQTNSESLTELVKQVYTDVYEPRQGPISMTALVKPNAILLVGRRENIDTVLELVKKLDRPVSPDTQIKVFRLLNMAAVDAEQYLRSFYGTPTGQVTTGTAGQSQQQVRGLSTRVAAIADFRSNSLIVQASSRDLLEVADLLKQLDVEKTEASIQLRVFPLKNAMATDLATVLQSTLGLQNQGAAGGQQFRPGGNQLAQRQGGISKSVQILGIDQKGNKIIESGLLTDVSVAADANSNSVVVKAPGHSMGLIAALIEQLDKIPAAESEIKVFQIRNGDATNLTTMLQNLFGQPVTAGQIGAFTQTYGRTFGNQPTLQPSTAGESSLIPLSFAVDARSNSIIASGSRADLAVVEAILLRLDEGDLRQRKLIVYRLNNAPAQFVADALAQILNDQRQLLQGTLNQQFSLISQFEFIDQQVLIVPEIISNTLIVSATPKYYEQITEVIEDLDRRPPMVMIQVVVALIRLDDAEEFGVELGLQDSLLFDRSTTALGLLTPGFNFVNRALGNSGAAESLATRQNLAGQAFSAFNVGRSSASEGFPGLVLSAGNESLNILIRALVKNSRAEVLSRPQIMTMNNVPASVLVGQRVPQVNNFQLTNQGSVNSVELIETGISLGVIPRVSPNGLIIMDIEARDSKVGDPAEGIPIGVQDGVAINSPIYDDITAITTVAARSGQTVVFGGLIVKERVETFRGVPFLSEVPVLGHLFRYDTKSDKRSELMFFLTPHIVMGDEDIQAMNQTEADRMSWCLADLIEMHGDPGFGSGRVNGWDDGTPVIFPDQDPTLDTLNEIGPVESVPTPEYDRPNVPSNVDSGRPFLRAPDQRQPGKPFLLPPGERNEGKPYFDPAPSSRRIVPEDGAMQAPQQNVGSIAGVYSGTPAVRSGAGPIQQVAPPYTTYQRQVPTVLKAERWAQASTGTYR